MQQRLRSKRKHAKNSWVRFNLDSGCSQTIFPGFWFPGGATNGNYLRTASGELVQTSAPMKITAEDNWGDTWSLRAKRLEKMHKLLDSAAVMAGTGWDQWLTAGGGWIYKHDSDVGRKIEALLEAEACKGKVRMLPVHEEGGVYNFYLYMGDKIKVEEVNGLVPPWPTKGSNKGSVTPPEGQSKVPPPPAPLQGQPATRV